MSEIRRQLESRKYIHKHNSFFIEISTRDIPWSRCTSAVAPALESLGVGQELIADSTWEYVQKASMLLQKEDSELIYEIKVKLFDALDKSPVSGRCFVSFSNFASIKDTSSTNGGICTSFLNHSLLNHKFLREDCRKLNSPTENGMFLSDLERYVFVKIYLLVSYLNFASHILMVVLL